MPKRVAMVSAELATANMAMNGITLSIGKSGSPAETTLVSGEVRTIPKPGPILIWATEGKSLQIEIKGKRYPMPFEGYNRAQIN